MIVQPKQENVLSEKLHVNLCYVVITLYYYHPIPRDSTTQLSRVVLCCVAVELMRNKCIGIKPSRVG